MNYVLIYIHGFLSSPASVKAQQTLKYMKENHPEITMELPEVPNYPGQAAQMLERIVTQHKDKKIRFIGSSMGGFMSTHLVEKFGGKAVLINPAVTPYILLKEYLGEHQNPYTKVNFTLTNLHIDELVNLHRPQLSSPEHYWVLLQTGDETLDYREAQDKYASSRLTIETGGDHSFQNFEQHLPQICEFLFEP